jgi:hypothetical protein
LKKYFFNYNEKKNILPKTRALISIEMKIIIKTGQMKVSNKKTDLTVAYLSR